MPLLQHWKQTARILDSDAPRSSIILLEKYLQKQKGYFYPGLVNN